MRKKIYAKLEGFSRYTLEGSLNNVIESLQEIQKNNPDKPDMSIYIEEEEEYGGTYTHAYIKYSREETDEEIRNRKAFEAKQIEYRKRQYEALKKEFGE